VIGAAAAVTTTIVIASRGPDEVLLPPIQCDDSGCRPSAR
jgi:hypothetical protein